ncbi:uncharacterized protein LOC116247861 isoform X3 [Nymphaea colorata]|uniref:uncharacterized protein LOC116247861 isoform X3 n=1 Tax=Nymphaea colorata TaxID=210225 RepID=UPI00129D4DB6|nr:uncharacterized protein LOC116247861 isoform X3 [Nymphaea colorata]
MVMNANVVKRDLLKVMLDSVSISQYLCVVVLVVCVWTYTLSARIDGRALHLFYAVLLGMGFLATWSLEESNTNQQYLPECVHCGVRSYCFLPSFKVGEKLLGESSLVVWRPKGKQTVSYCLPRDSSTIYQMDGSFHSPEWHAARLASLNTSHTITWEEFKKKQRATRNPLRSSANRSRSHDFVDPVLMIMWNLLEIDDRRFEDADEMESEAHHEHE